MLFWTIIKSAFQSLWANKLRSVLAMLGIIIGVGAVIAMVAMGSGAQADITARFASMGTNLLFVSPAQSGSGGVISGTQITLVVDDAKAMAELPGVLAVSPVVNGSAQVQYMNRNNRTRINGVSMMYFEMRNFELEKGRLFTEPEAEGLARVAVLGPNVANTLFSGEEPVGSTIKINNINFKVIGVLKSKGSQGWANPDDQALVPYTTAMKILFGATSLGEVDISVANVEEMAAVSGQPPNTGGFGPPRMAGRGGTVHTVPPPTNSVTALLRRRHKLTDLAKADDFQVQNMAEALANLSGGLMTFRLLLGGIAAISLLVGGIGIMNIMLVTVTERTREIGTRKAIGAKGRDIMMQFLVESLVMAALGGAIGAAWGIGLAKLVPCIPMFKSFSMLVEPWVVATSIAVSGLVGVFSGLYPAYRASQLDPIEALRYE